MPSGGEHVTALGHVMPAAHKASVDLRTEPEMVKTYTLETAVNQREESTRGGKDFYPIQQQVSARSWDWRGSSLVLAQVPHNSH